MKEFLFSIVLLALLSPVAVWAEGGDELWEMTTKMEVVGMPETIRVSSVCMPKGAAYKPVKSPAQKKCETSAIEVSGNKTKWKMECFGRNPMKGRGEMERSGNAMSGKTEMVSRKLKRSQEISGKLVGSCQAK